jgi:transcriptional regulator with XRE-family HTH domain
MKKVHVDPAILRARELFKRSGKTLDELGRELGLEGGTARRGAWQLLNKVADPKISTLRALAQALGAPIEELVGGSKVESEKALSGEDLHFP